jgi:hypothetical protein
MQFRTRFLLVAATLVAGPMAGALAQSNPAGNLGSNKSVTAAPNTVDQAGPGKLHSAESNVVPAPPSPGATDRRVPGATGRTVVPGTNSSVAGDGRSTADTKAGAHSAN